MIVLRAIVWRPIAAIFLALSLAACLTPGAGTRFYVLNPSAEPVTTPRSAGKHRTFVITDIRLPLYLDRPQIVSKQAQNGLSWSETAQWGGHLREDMGRILAINLERLLPGDHIVLAPYPMPSPPDGRITLEIRNFELQTDGRVLLSAQFWITGGQDNPRVYTMETTTYSKPLGNSPSTGVIVQAMSEVYGRMAHSIANRLSAMEAE